MYAIRSYYDQSALITNLDLSGRFRTTQFDNRMVIRNTNTADFLGRGNSRNRLTAAYYDFKYLPINQCIVCIKS